MEKSPAILQVVEDLRLRLGPGSFDVLDYWPGDPHTVGIGSPGGDEPCVCILTADKAPGRYDVGYGGTIFRDCVIEGLVWAVQHELRAQRHTKPDVAPDDGRIRRSKESRSPRRHGR